MHYEVAVDLPNLRVEALHITKYDEDFRSKVMCLIRKAYRVDEKLLTWLDTPSDDYMFTTHPTEHFDNFQDLPQQIHSYKSISAAATWIQWRLNRLRVLYIIQELMCYLGPSNISLSHRLSTLSKPHGSEIHALVDDIYCSVPYEQAQFIARQSTEKEEMTFTGSVCHGFPGSVSEYLSCRLILRPLEVGLPIDSIEGVEFAGGEYVPWSREYIELYARFPCTMTG